MPKVLETRLTLKQFAGLLQNKYSISNLRQQAIRNSITKYPGVRRAEKIGRDWFVFIFAPKKIFSK